MKKMDRPRQLHVLIPESLYKRLKKEAERGDRTMGAVVRRALEAYLDEEGGS